MTSIDNIQEGEHLIGVKWVNALPREKAFWEKNSDLFSSQLVVASLDRQKRTIEFLEKSFDVSFDELLTQISSEKVA